MIWIDCCLHLSFLSILFGLFHSFTYLSICLSVFLFTSTSKLWLEEMTHKDSFSQIFRRTRRFGMPGHRPMKFWWLLVMFFAPAVATVIAKDVSGGINRQDAQKISSSQHRQTTQRDGQRETFLDSVITRQQQQLRQRQQYLQKETTIHENDSTVAAFKHRSDFKLTKPDRRMSTERQTEDQEALPTTSIEDATWHAEQEGGTEGTTTIATEENTQNSGLQEGTNNSSTTATTMGLFHMTLWPGRNGSTFPPENTESATQPPDAEAANQTSSTSNDFSFSESSSEVGNVSNETIAIQGTDPANEAGNMTATGTSATTSLESTQTASPSNEQSLVTSSYIETTLPPTPGAFTSSSTSNPDAATPRPSMSAYQYPKPPQPAPTLPPKPTTAPPSSAPLVYEAPDDDVLKQNAQDDQIVKDAWTPKSPMQQAQETASAMMNDRNVKIAVSIASVVAVALLLCTAHHLLERPEGLCARICKLTLAASNIVCLPCRMLLCCPWCNRNGSRRGGHILVANDASGNDGFGFSHDLELS